MKNFMKAKAGIFLIAILMIAFTGFGATTADPIQNSKDQVAVERHADMVSVVAAKAVQIQVMVLSIGSTDSVNDVALKTSGTKAHYSSPNPLKILYYQDGYDRHGTGFIHNINKPPSNSNCSNSNDSIRRHADPGSLS
ncbi:hypothetical protein [Aequorivita echinoideorum]|uniref:Uncharacterized protein n=1 Tax=Aequorivita echinoideorum TaxID=1549647 RepID=A0ABS5S347_9FLAO|nr:hypothetical protein [Aequorivita echinoideorum]MBT0607636.1 hypothetical protein [Aequorivita echinoideorum]